MIRRDWSDARQKVDDEGRCRRCLLPPDYDRALQAAHIVGRTYDRPRVEGSTTKVLYVHPDSIVPLCATPQGDGCHQLYDAHRIGILGFLTREEQVRAVEDAGSIESARRRLDPLDYVEEIRQARIDAQAVAR